MGSGDFLDEVDPACLVRKVHGGTSTAQDFFALCKDRPKTECKLVVERHPKIISYFVDQVSQGRVFIDLDQNTVIKQVTDLAGFGVLNREIRWLRIMQPFGRSPFVLAQYNEVVVLDYLGEPLRQYNLPDDWRLQAEEILNALGQARCCHNDIKCDNLVVRNGRLSLIDFGWATAKGQVVPSNWPHGLGRQHRLAPHQFDDRHAILAACTEAEQGLIRPSIRMTSLGC